MKAWIKKLLSRFFTIKINDKVVISKGEDAIKQTPSGTVIVKVEIDLDKNTCHKLLQRRHDHFKIELEQEPHDAQRMRLLAEDGTVLLDKTYSHFEYKKQSDINVTVDGDSDHFSFEAWLGWIGGD